MAIANLYCTFILLLYLQGNYAQQGNNQNVGINNAIGFQQQAMQRTNAPNNINQMPNGGLNINLQQQSNMQQGNLQQPISANQGNLQQSFSLPANLQTSGTSGPLANIQFTQQGLSQLPPGLVSNPSKLQTVSTQFNNAGGRQNAQNTQQQSIGTVSNVPTSQTQTAPLSSNSLAELAAIKGHPSLLSFFAPQNAVEPQKTQQMSMANFNPAQNQLTDAEKQFLVRAFQSQSYGQNQPGSNVQTQIRVASGNNQPVIAVQGQPVSPQQAQAFLTPINNNQPPYITVQAQPLTTYLQSQQPQVEEPSIMSLILSELQPSDPQYTVYPPYPGQKGSKSNLKSLIPLIINLLKEKNGCGCNNCGCPNNGRGNNNMPEPNIVNPVIFSGYSNQKMYGTGTGESSKKTNEVEESKSKSNKDKKNVKENTVNVDSEEVSEENDSSEYIDDSEGD